MLGAVALIPGIILLRHLIEKSLFPILNALVIFYFVDRLREVTDSLPIDFAHLVFGGNARRDYFSRLAFALETSDR